MNGISKPADEHLSGRQHWLAANGCFDLVWQCCWVMFLATGPEIQLLVWPPLALFIYSWLQTLAPKNTMIDWKIDLFFIIENFLGILNRVCAEPMHRRHDFLSLTLAGVGSTSGRCYFLQQCWCLSVCVLCVLVVRCVKS